MYTARLIEEKLKMLHLPQKFIDKIQHDLEYIFSCDLQELQQIILFGSCARGKVKATSDVDWLLVTNSPMDRKLRHQLLCDLCEEYNGVSADLVITTVDQRQEKNTTFMRLVSEDEIILWEREKNYD